MDFQIALDDLERCRVADTPAAELASGQARLAVEKFGLTSNNITYAKFGEAMSYWRFFPAADGWGHMPVWGFAVVSESNEDALAVGTRVYGYLPPASELVVTPERVNERGFRDASAHRAELPGAYNAYSSTEADPFHDAEHEDLELLLRPLFFTSWLIDDFLADGGLLDGNALVLSSASSKTAIGLAFLLSRREDVEVIGLSSRRGAEFARALGCYTDVLAYEEVPSLLDRSSVYVDMAGDANVRESVHRHFDARLQHSMVVGATHHDRMGALPDDLPGPRPRFFFAPDQVSKRTSEWGAAELERRLADGWEPFLEWAGGWLEVIHGDAPAVLEDAYLGLLRGEVDPARAHVLTM
jgi:Protein of unknown function (DUF2855)